MMIHTYQVLSAARAAMQAAGDAESGEGSFIITGDPAFLSEYRKAKDQMVPASIADLERLLKQNGEQRKRLDRLRLLLDEEFNEIGSTVEVRRDQNLEAARALFTAQHRNRVLDKIRTVVSELDNHEEAALTRDSQRVSASERRILWVAVITGALSITARIILAVRAAGKPAQ